MVYNDNLKKLIKNAIYESIEKSFERYYHLNESDEQFRQIMFLVLANNYIGRNQKFVNIVKNAQLIHCHHITEAFTPEQIKRFSINTFREHECWLNALKVCLSIPEAEYCEGVINVHGFPIEHAWNKIGDKFVDVTEDIVLKGSDEHDYYLYKTFSNDEVNVLIEKYDTHDSFVKKECGLKY